MQEASSPPSSAESESSSPSGWLRLPLEILELIMDMLDDDTPTLASILQVDRQSFFAAVPRLYRDPFFRIREIYRRKCHSIRIDAHRTETGHRLRPKTPSDHPSSFPLTKEEETALKVWNAYRTKAFFEQDDAAINLTWKKEAQERERKLLVTLMSTLLQDLCVRFPAIADSFLPPPSPLSAPASASTSSAASGTYTMTKTSGTMQGYPSPLDFGPHFREITWTSQHYLRHWTVIDLEKLSTRGRHLHYAFYESFADGDSKDQDGLFNCLFQDRENWMIGVPEYLQRALLNQPGADRIVTLRIPIRRVRSFQDRLDRAPRGWARAKSIRMWGSSRTSSMRRGEEQEAREARDRLRAAKKEEDETRGRSLDVVALSSLLTKTSLSPEERKCARTAGESDHTVDVSSRPYCFTLNKLTNLRRIEICNLSQNHCDWETLRRALFTLEFGDDSGVELEDLGKMKPTPALQKKRSRPGKIRELCLTAQSTLGPEIDRVLECLGGLEVLEIITPSYQYYPWVTTWDPSLCRELRVLRVGEIGQLVESNVSLEDLGRFWRLEELRLRIDSGHVFQWVVDAKKEARRVSVTGASTLRARAGAVGSGGENALLVNCLPHLKKLGVLNRQDLSVDVLTTVAEAFGDQLEELVICFSGQEGPLRFKHPLTNLTRLAIRLTSLMRFEFESLPQQCPLLEWIIIQHTRFSGSHPDHDVNGDESNPTTMSTERRPYYDILNRKIVDVLGQFTRLRTVYTEGHSTMRGEHLRVLVDRCLSLRRIGIYMMPAVTTEELAAIDTELRCRPEKFPLLQRGVYRLPSRMSNYLDRNFHWQVLQWGYDLDE